MTLREWLVLAVVAPSAVASCTLTLGFDGYSGGGSEDAGTPCVSPCKVVGDLTPGSIGSGFTLNWKTLPEREVAGGFIEDGKVVLAVYIAGEEGIVMSVELANGKRELRSGDVTDISNMPWSVGKGPGLEELRALRPSSAGKWLAHSWPDGSNFEGWIVEVDAASGTRGSSIALMKECPSFSSGIIPRGTHSLIDPSGEAVWIAYQSIYEGEDDGVLRIDALGCKPFATPGISPFALTERDGKIWMLDIYDSILGTLDPSNGESHIVSGAGSSPGAANLLLDVEATWIIDAPALAFTRVDVGGNRAPLAGISGPAAAAVENPPFGWLHPDGHEIVLALDGAIVVLDPSTGQSHFVSY